MKQNNILKPVFALLLLAAIGRYAPAEETEKPAVSAVLENGTKDEEISEYEEKRAVILYGLGDDILELIKRLKQDEDTRFDQDLQEMFLKTKIPALKAALFSYFSEKQSGVLQAEALAVLENRYEYQKEIVRAAISYIKEIKTAEAAEQLKTILKEDTADFGDACISALGKIGSPEDAVFLAEFFESEISEDEKQTLITKQNIMFALEELHYAENKEFFKQTAEDTDENAIIRGTAASALGKIGDEDVLPILTALFEDKDPYLRASAIKGVAEFKSKEAEDVLLQGFKDSYYKVRLQAVRSAKEAKRGEAVPYLLYRAKKDPETVVKKAAIEALSELNNGEANNWLVESFKSEKTGQPVRLTIAEFLLKNNFAVIYPDVEKEALKIITDPKRKQFCMELGKVISKIENASTAPVAEAYLNHKDTMIKSIGLDMFKRNKYSSLVPLVSSIARDKKSGALGRRAKSLLEIAGHTLTEEEP